MGRTYGKAGCMGVRDCRLGPKELALLEPVELQVSGTRRSDCGFRFVYRLDGVGYSRPENLAAHRYSLSVTVRLGTSGTDDRRRHVAFGLCYPDGFWWLPDLDFARRWNSREGTPATEDAGARHNRLASLPSPDALAETLTPPCRFGRRYDANQRRRAVFALHDLRREAANEQCKRAADLLFADVDLPDLVDTIAFHLGLFMSPQTRDANEFDVELWSRRRWRQ